MLSNELTIWGYIKVPYPYLESFIEKNKELKATKDYKDFPDFTMPPILSIGNALITFAYVYKYEENFEKTVIKRFEVFLGNVKFLQASLQLEIEGAEIFFLEYVSNGQEIYKTNNDVFQNKVSEKLE